MNVYELIQMVGQNVWLYGGSLVIILGILIFVHEWGHYIVARMCGVHVEKFSIGFGKEIYGFTDKAGTRWKISMFPLGGFVQLFGDTDPASSRHSDKVEDGEEIREMTTEERKVAFFTKKLWQRALIVLAGPGINYLFAIILLAGLYLSYGQPVSPPTAAAIISASPISLLIPCVSPRWSALIFLIRIIFSFSGCLLSRIITEYSFFEFRFSISSGSMLKVF